MRSRWRLAVAGAIGAGHQTMREAGIERIEVLAPTTSDREAAMRDPLPLIEAAAGRVVMAHLVRTG